MLRKLRMLTAGESHGPALTGILEGLPAGLEIDTALIEEQLRRRRKVGGRGGRMKIEADRVEITAGVRQGVTLGSPVALIIRNRDHDNWLESMSVLKREAAPQEITVPRPGHIDLAGCFKYDTIDSRNVSERASARETALRTALAACCRQLLQEVGITVGSRVVQIGAICDTAEYRGIDPLQMNEQADSAAMRCLDSDCGEQMEQEVARVTQQGDTLGGRLEIQAAGVPAGLGSSTQWDLKMQARLAGALMSIGGMKGFEVGSGLSVADMRGSEMHDGILPQGSGISRSSNNAGGIEGGLSNGETITLRLAMKPLPTLRRKQSSVDLKTGLPAAAPQERGDSCAVAAASIVAEAMTCLVLADALLEKFGGDTMEQLRQHLQASGRWPSSSGRSYEG